MLLIDKIKTFNLNSNDLWGLGHAEVRASSYEQFSAYETGLGTKGALNGFYKIYLTMGLFAAIFLILWYYSMLKYIINKRLRYVLLVFLIWEFFFYHGVTFDLPPAMLLYAIIIWYANNNYLRNKPEVNKPKANSI